MSALFGPAGRDDSYDEYGYKSSFDIPRIVSAKGLDAFEYQCGRGVNIGVETAKALGAQAKEFSVALSLHAPYYISMSGVEKEKREKSVDYILQSAVAADAMGATRVIIHTGSCSKITREEALELASDTMKKALNALDERKLSHIRLCPETMGKVNQLGTLQEVVELCRLDERLIPCIDFGHLNARTFGGIKTSEEYRKIFDYVENHLGYSRLREFHSHFSKIEYTMNGGEKQHLTFDDIVYGPDYEPMLNLVVQKGCEPVIICESAGTQSKDAKILKDYYNSIPDDIGSEN